MYCYTKLQYGNRLGGKGIDHAWKSHDVLRTVSHLSERTYYRKYRWLKRAIIVELNDV